MHNATQGKAKDTLESLHNLHLRATEPVYKIVQMWKQIFLEDTKAEILHLTHSQGAIQTTLGLILLPTKWRNQITVIGIAPALPVSPDLCKRARNYCSKRDFVPSLGKKVFGYKLPSVVVAVA